MRRFVFVAVACCALPGVTLADTVYLKDGRKLQGSVSQDGDELVVRQKLGVARVKKADVLKIEDVHDAWDEFVQLRSQLGAGTADERYRLGVFARRSNFEREARKAFLSVLRVDIDHPGARAALDYVRHQNRWITREDLNRARGLVKHRGQWMKPKQKAEKEKQERAEQATRRKAKTDAKAKAVADRKKARKTARAQRRERTRDLEARRRAYLAYERSRDNSPYANRSGRVLDTYYRTGRVLYPYYPTWTSPYGCGTVPYYGGNRTYRRFRSSRRRGYGLSASGTYKAKKWGLSWRLGY